ncbi:DUF2970 domain-containing protein [Alteromonas sp. ASW11-130]|uniref:DUF2970 domain-containing protein n=1 Tax=Alteromonas sp. ASW11-130 TaxID=3015775 RepID=UPI002241E200|nr:DUF2970 domain-containing protein [Alteromonas sp. ASW11-130]MCW8090934.1 DUF2970 domain-containing protein [Alteromonas sp. ASW11-130]
MPIRIFRVDGNKAKSTAKPKLLQVISSVLASALGVQSHKNYSRDFEHGSLVIYLVVGVVFVAAFVTGLLTLVAAITS